MNYRHAFHAGGLADVVKHALLTRVLVHLRDKPAPFRVIDTHAGAGLYDLRGLEANRGAEAHDGIQRLASNPPDGAARTLLAPYLDAVSALNRDGAIVTYPGSPAIARAFLRATDRLIACELEPNAAAALARNLGRDRRVKTVAIDGWVALNAYVPPPERRGVVLIDPPFEQPEDFERLARGLEGAHRKWATGIFVVWYPIKERALPDALARKLRRTGIPKMLRIEIDFGEPSTPGRLVRSGLIVVNPPWTLPTELEILLPTLARTLGRGGGSCRIDWLAGVK